MSRPRSLPRLRLTDVGATLVEYALVIGLIAVASLGAIQFMQGAGHDRLEDRRTSAGAPDVNAAALPGGTGGTDGSSSSGGTDDGGTPTVQPHAGLSWTANRQGNAWSATVTITVTDPANSNAPVAGAVVAGVWNPSQSGQTSCTTNLSGQCGVTQGGMEARSNQPGYVSQVTFSVTGITGPDVDYMETPPSTPPIPAP